MPAAAGRGVGLVVSAPADASHAPPLDGLGREREHVERPERTRVVLEKLVKAGVAARCISVDGREATRDEALSCHSVEHCDALDALERAPPRVGTGGWSQAAGWSKVGTDMYHGQATPRAARLAAGGVLALTQRVCCGRLRSGFAVVRPPGHHACTERMCGFCFLNSVAMAARMATRRHGLQRVAIVDFDVHHGNGTQQVFEHDPSVLFLSLHRIGNGFFPGSGEASSVGSGDGEGFSVNVPWRHEGMGDAEYLAAFDGILMPILNSYAPQLILVSAGFDAAAGDKVGGMAVSAEGFAAMVSRLQGVASANGHVVCALEGGYKPSVVAKCVLACVRTLLADADDAATPTADAAAAGRGCGGTLGEAVLSPSRLARGASHALGAVLRVQAKHWPVLADQLCALEARICLRTSRPSRTSERTSERFSETDDTDGASSSAAASSMASPLGSPLRPSPLDSPLRSSPLGSPSRGSSSFASPLSSPLASPDRGDATAAPQPGHEPSGHGPSSHEVCVACGRSLPRASFSSSQVRKRRAGQRRCKGCAGGGGGGEAGGGASHSPVTLWPVPGLDPPPTHAPPAAHVPPASSSARASLGERLASLGSAAGSTLHYLAERLSVGSAHGAEGAAAEEAAAAEEEVAEELCVRTHAAGGSEWSWAPDLAAPANADLP